MQRQPLLLQSCRQAGLPGRPLGGLFTRVFGGLDDSDLGGLGDSILGALLDGGVDIHLIHQGGI